jgi:hypothetical protein
MKRKHVQVTGESERQPAHLLLQIQRRQIAPSQQFPSSGHEAATTCDEIYAG